MSIFPPSIFRDEVGQDGADAERVSLSMRGAREEAELMMFNVSATRLMACVLPSPSLAASTPPPIHPLLPSLVTSSLPLDSS